MTRSGSGPSADRLESGRDGEGGKLDRAKAGTRNRPSARATLQRAVVSLFLRRESPSFRKKWKRQRAPRGATGRGEGRPGADRRSGRASGPEFPPLEVMLSQGEREKLLRMEEEIGRPGDRADRRRAGRVRTPFRRARAGLQDENRPLGPRSLFSRAHRPSARPS